MEERVERAVCGRLAPTPSGRMHLGNLWAALLAWLSARSAGGQLLLRLEDLDPQRCKPEYSDQMLRDLEWLGLDWDKEPVYQSRRRDLYKAALNDLKRQELVYPCFCSRSDLSAATAPHGSDGTPLYDGRCRKLAQRKWSGLMPGRRHAFRVEVPDLTVGLTDRLLGPYEENLARDCGDFILRRSDGVYAYQLAVVVDDGEMGVTEVVRGSDLLSSAPRQLWLAQRLGLPQVEFAHIPLLLSGDGRRLAKRDKDQTLEELKRRFTPPEVVGRLALLAGILPVYRPITPRELIPQFRWDRMPKKGLRVEGLF